MMASKGVTAEAVKALNTETPEEEIKYRKAMSKGGKPVMRDGQPLMLAYVTARYVQDTLDDIVGPANWQTVFTPLVGGAVECALSVNIDGEWITKKDVGVPSSIEPEKGAYSDSFKRAAVHWGIARDLYDERDAEPAEVEEAAPRAEGRGNGAPIQSRVRGGATNVTPIRGRSGGGGGRRPQPTEEEDAEVVASFDPDNSPWYCPVHDDVKIIPGGISKRTNKRYSPFLACSVPGCDERGPFMNDLN
jgi:hypothetical protein